MCQKGRRLAKVQKKKIYVRPRQGSMKPERFGKLVNCNVSRVKKKKPSFSLGRLSYRCWETTPDERGTAAKPVKAVVERQKVKNHGAVTRCMQGGCKIQIPLQNEMGGRWTHTTSVNARKRRNPGLETAVRAEKKAHR